MRGGCIDVAAYFPSLHTVVSRVYVIFGWVYTIHHKKCHEVQEPAFLGLFKPYIDQEVAKSRGTYTTTSQMKLK
jgi:hypothetical protein